jgi:hypothetical protein
MLVACFRVVCHCSMNSPFSRLYLDCCNKISVGVRTVRSEQALLATGSLFIGLVGHERSI